MGDPILPTACPFTNGQSVDAELLVTTTCPSNRTFVSPTLIPSICAPLAVVKSDNLQSGTLVSRKTRSPMDTFASIDASIVCPDHHTKPYVFME